MTNNIYMIYGFLKTAKYNFLSSLTGKGYKNAKNVYDTIGKGFNVASDQYARKAGFKYQRGLFRQDGQWGKYFDTYIRPSKYRSNISGDIFDAFKQKYPLTNEGIKHKKNMNGAFDNMIKEKNRMYRTRAGVGAAGAIGISSLLGSSDQQDGSQYVYDNQNINGTL